MDPRNTRWRERLGISHNFVGHLLEWTGDVQGALEHRRQEVAVTRELHQLDPQNAVWQRNFAIAQMTYATTLRLTGATAAAAGELAKARETMSGLLSRRDPSGRGNAISPASRPPPLAFISRPAMLPLQSVPLPRRSKSWIRSAWRRRERHTSPPPTLRSATRLVPQATRPSRAMRGRNRRRCIAPMTASEQTPQILDTLARALLQLGRRDEAAPLVTRLMSVGYRSPDFVHAASTTQ